MNSSIEALTVGTLGSFRCEGAAKKPADGFAKSHASPLFRDSALLRGREKGSFGSDSPNGIFLDGELVA
jgi:hypothetical protein